uniref:Retrovirus-related Pol polyprotein from transposon TNT 1-94-like beta-barrel domain-containing protein n=1 Tax=Physcomitrium patens TaxID=3218 RepID=A0A2K1L0A3_PHYPA|nr:hypothetical protein PHYPA_002248 [Physcomitrium patens]
MALPKSYAAIITVMTNGQTKLNLEAVKSTLLAEWSKKNQSLHEDDSAALAVRGRPATFQGHCHEKGHRKSDCPSLRKKKHFLYDGASTSSAGIVIANFDNGAYVLCTSAFGDNKWMLDLDSSYHTCPKHSFFYTYQETFGCIEVENGVYHDIVGMGNGRFRMFDGIVRTLTNIKHILDI